LVPFCIFTDPELARVGLNESEARARGIEYRVARMPAEGVLRTWTLSETRGFLKMLIDQHSNRIPGHCFYNRRRRVDGCGPDGNPDQRIVHPAPRSDLHAPDRARDSRGPGFLERGRGLRGLSNHP